MNKKLVLFLVLLLNILNVVAQNGEEYLFDDGFYMDFETNYYSLDRASQQEFYGNLNIFGGNPDNFDVNYADNILLVSIVSGENIYIGDYNQRDVTITLEGGSINVGGNDDLNPYSGIINLEGGGTITTIDGLEYTFGPGGSVEIKDGKIAKIEDGNLVEAEFTVFLYNPIIITGEGVSYDSATNLISSTNAITLNGKTITPETDTDLVIEVKDTPIIDTRGSFILVTDESGTIGRLNGRITFPKEEERDFQISPSSDEQYAEFELEAGLTGKVSENTKIDFRGSTYLGPIPIESDECTGGISCISLNGELNVLAKDNNDLDIMVSDERFSYININRIQDESTILLSLGNEEGDTYFVFQKNEPIVHPVPNDLTTLIGTQFLGKDGQIWSWELTEGNSLPDIYQRNILYLYSNFGQMDMSMAGYYDMTDGSFQMVSAPPDLMLRRLLARPIGVGTSHTNKETFLEGHNMHFYNLYIDQFKDTASFIDELKEDRLPESEQFERLVLVSHGKPTHFEMRSPITIDDLRNIAPEDLDSIQSQFTNDATCTAYSCLIFANIEDPTKTEEVFGSQLALSLGMPVIGSVSPLFYAESNEITSFYSTKMVVAYPEDDGTVRIEETPP